LKILPVALIFGAVLLLTSRKAKAAEQIMLTGALDPSQSDAETQARVQALLAVIRRFESGDDYQALVGGGQFFDFSVHPFTVLPTVHLVINGRTVPTTAAGAYQINLSTYHDFAARQGLADFSPATQDALAYAILADTGAVDALAAGDIQTAFNYAARRWASLPGSTAGQNPKPMTTALADYAANYSPA
jgi:muramidase (phage lysozyme)